MVLFPFRSLDFLSNISVSYKRGVVKSSGVIVDLTNYHFTFVSFCFMYLNPVVKVHKRLGLVCQPSISLYCYLTSSIPFLYCHIILSDFRLFPLLFIFRSPFFPSFGIVEHFLRCPLFFTISSLTVFLVAASGIIILTYITVTV